MNTIRFTVGLFALLLLASCQAKQTDIPVVDIDNPTGSVDLKISDLLDNISIVPLETRDDLLLTTASGTSFTITGHYIIVKTNEKLLQFDRQGNYIRTLAYRGNGPNEFISIMTMLIDETRGILYYNDARRDASVFSIDLNSGKFLAFPNSGLPSSSIRAIDAEGNIYGNVSSASARMNMNTSGTSLSLSSSTQRAPDSLVLAYKYNPADSSTTTFAGSHGFIVDHRNQIFLRQGDHISFLYLPYSDTLYRLEGSHMVPQYIIQFKNQMTDLQQGGITIGFSFPGNGSLIISKSDTKITLGDDRVFVLSQTLAYLFLDRKATLKTIKSITIDPIAVTIDIDNYLKPREQRSREIAIAPIPRVSGIWGYYAVEALDMVEFIDQALKGNQLSAVQRKALEEVAAKIDDDSNPVLIIGKIK
ncbi:MAG: 6-bladed beta-propeller [Bacteroidales bacterium]|nr:6-bladed beta-propeller [Bacteroidales bacterium]